MSLNDANACRWPGRPEQRDGDTDDQERQKADQERQKGDQERKKGDQERKKGDQERKKGKQRRQGRETGAAVAAVLGAVAPTHLHSWGQTTTVSSLGGMF